jgi:hypothetical protein
LDICVSVGIKNSLGIDHDLAAHRADDREIASHVQVSGCGGIFIPACI